MCNILYTSRPNSGSISVSKVVTGMPDDETYFHVILTGASSEIPIADGWLKTGQTIKFSGLPFDTYTLTEDAVGGYSLVSISGTVTLNRANRKGGIDIVNEVEPETLVEITFDDISNAPVSDPSSISEWNEYFMTKSYDYPQFSNVSVVGNKVTFTGGSVSELYLDSMNLVEIGKLNIHNVSDLYCNNNMLTSLPELKDLNIIVLDCSYNQINTLPELPNSIRGLNCLYNQLTSVPLLPSGALNIALSNNKLPSSVINSIMLWATPYANCPYLQSLLLDGQTPAAPPDAQIRANLQDAGFNEQRISILTYD